MVLLRQMLGDALRRLRLRQGRTLREVSAAARVSLGYLSEVERGQKEASSELLASICGALGAPLSQVLREVSDSFALAELQNEPAFSIPLEPALTSHVKGEASAGSAHRIPAPARQPAKQRLVMPGGQPKLTVRTAQRLAQGGDQVLDPVSLPAGEQDFESFTRDITDMVPV
jgi:transcriptional regulator with XRE-family HTH domain